MSRVQQIWHDWLQDMDRGPQIWMIVFKLWAGAHRIDMTCLSLSYGQGQHIYDMIDFKIVTDAHRYDMIAFKLWAGCHIYHMIDFKQWTDARRYEMIASAHGVHIYTGTLKCHRRIFQMKHMVGRVWVSVGVVSGWEGLGQCWCCEWLGEFGWVCMVSDWKGLGECGCCEWMWVLVWVWVG